MTADPVDGRVLAVDGRVLAVDGGGAKTDLALLDANGALLSFVRTERHDRRVPGGGDRPQRLAQAGPVVSADADHVDVVQERGLQDGQRFVGRGGPDAEPTGHRLAQLGVARKVADLIDRAIAKRIRLRGKPETREDAKKLFDHLLRQGFEFELASEKVRALAKSDADEAGP